MTASIRIVRFGPARPWFQPDTNALVKIELVVATGLRARVTVELLDLDRVVAVVERTVRLAAGRAERRVKLPLPGDARRGYGLRLTIVGPDGATLRAHAAVEALDGWWQSPRHAAITEFRSPASTAANVRALLDWHVTVVQDYDWMYRHYRYAPPSRARRADGTFLDALGRPVSHAAVRAGIRAGHAVGIATLAYGSVYGAEREYVDRHPGERVFDEAGQPLSLGETFYINDLRRGRPWRRRLLAEYARAIRDVGFDGVHMDTYGPPHRAVAGDGEPIDFAALYPGLIDEGAATVARVRPGARVLFNCVEGFPLEAVADHGAAAVYLELWPPDVRYVDLIHWIERARRAGRGRAVVIAAYLSILRSSGDDPADRPRAVEAAVLLTSVISAAGAYHHVLAERNRVLVEGYYPEARRLGPREAAELRAAWTFGARHVHILTDPAAEPASLEGVEVRDQRGEIVALSAEPAAGRVWARATQRPDGSRVLQLLDLRAQSDDHWDALRAPAVKLVGWRLRWPDASNLVAMSPWTRDGQARRPMVGADGLVRLPSFRRWLVVVDRANCRT